MLSKLFEGFNWICVLNTPLCGFTIFLPKILCTTEIDIFKTATRTIIRKYMQRCSNVAHVYNSMYAPTEGATELVKGWNKITWSSSEAKFLFSFSSNLEEHSVVKSASLAVLKHEALDPQCQHSAGTGQASCLPTCCPANTVHNRGK